MRNELEKVIQNQILDFLAAKGVYMWPNQSVGIYDSKIGRYRKNKNVHNKLGVSDILGILNGRFLAIEVKKKGGYPTPEQREFLKAIRDGGGIAMIARSIKDVDDALLEQEPTWKKSVF